MTARGFAIARALRSLLVPLALALPPLFWVLSAADRASRTPLGRDQGIFQYIGWALAQGQVDYRDVRDVNGPLTHLVHRVLLAFGGADEHRFHALDLAITGLSFAFVGACLPGLAGRRRPDGLERAGWALAGWVVLSGQYLLYRYWDLAQRESFFDWFLFPAVALQLVAQAPWIPAPRQARLLAVSGALAVVPWFGKPTFALFTFVQVATIAADRLSLPRRRALAAFAGGGVAAGAAMTALLFAYGDAGAFLRVQLLDVPALYRFMWPHAAAEILSNPWVMTPAVFAVSGAVVLLSLIAVGEMPVRSLTIALLGVCALANVLVQAKGFPYHYHPVTAGIHLQWLAFAAWLAGRARVAQRRRALVRLAPLIAALAVSFRVATDLADSPHIHDTWLLWSGGSAEDRTTREYFSHFPERDFFPFEMRQAAAFLREHTRESDRVQTYGMDPYVLFLAGRLSATPYIYAYDLDVDAALAGGTGGVPTERQAERIRAIAEAHEADLLARLQAQPPAAFVFLDGSPLISEPDAREDFASHCPQASDWFTGRYREVGRFGHDHVWLRADVEPELPSLETPGRGDEPTSPEKH